MSTVAIKETAGARVVSRVSVAGAATVALGLSIGGIGADNAGYFPPSWGWSTILFSWALVVTLVVSRGARFGVLDWSFLGLLATLSGWIWLSAVWSTSVTRSILEGERSLVLISAVAAALALVRRERTHLFFGAILAGITAVCLYALATRLFPDRVSTFDSIGGYRLSRPIGYWNALGLYAVIGSFVALGFAMHARSIAARAASSLALLVLPLTLYFTYSRGSWIALGAGLVVAVLVSPSRLRLVNTILLLGALPAVVILIASRSDALTHVAASAPAASDDGNRLALVILLFAFPQALLAAGVGLLGDRDPFPRVAHLVYGSVLIAVAAASLSAVFVKYGSPVTLVDRAKDSFTKKPSLTGTNLNERLFQFSWSGRVLLWRVARTEIREHPWLGSGAGTYEQFWLADRREAATVRDAHSLYLETLAEIGPIGLALLALVFAVPVAAALRARRHPLAAAALGGLVAYVVHAAVDWDWEMPAITVAALFVGVGLVALARSPDLERRGFATPFRYAVAAAAIGISALGFIGLAGNRAVAQSQDAAERGDWIASADHARTAKRWAPWSAEPLGLLGEAKLARRHLGDARQTLRKAIAKDPRNWELWFDLSAAERGPASHRAFAEAKQLNPLSTELGDFEKATAVTEQPVPGSGT